MSPHWIAVTEPAFPWEWEALSYVRERLPEQEPFRAWSNFEFVADDGSINEVDLLVVSLYKIYLVEIKSRPGRVAGDVGTWTWSHAGRVYTDDNPLLLTNRKTKKLKALLQRQKALESTIESDCAAVSGLVQALLAAGLTVHCLRDLTRGGLASALVEIAEAAGVHITIDERVIPVREDVRGACEILGLDPLYVANEGRFVCFVPAPDAAHALAIMRAHPLGTAACHIGHVTTDAAALVTLQSQIGARRIVDLLSGEQLPRIC